MAQATINARLNATVKERGDKVLRDNGISTTEAIRGLWSSMARTREGPQLPGTGMQAGRGGGAPT